MKSLARNAVQIKFPSSLPESRSLGGVATAAVGVPFACRVQGIVNPAIQGSGTSGNTLQANGTGGGGGTRGKARAQSGPQLGFRVQVPRRQGIAPDAGGGLARALGPCEPTRRCPPGRAGTSVCRGPGVSPGLEAGRDSAQTHRLNVTSSPDTGGLAVSAGSRCVERETVLGVPGCRPSAPGSPPIYFEARWPARRAEPDHPAVAGFGAPARQTGSPWWSRGPRPIRSGPAPMGRGRRAAPASPLGTRRIVPWKAWPLQVALMKMVLGRWVGCCGPLIAAVGLRCPGGGGGLQPTFLGCAGAPLPIL